MAPDDDLPAEYWQALPAPPAPATSKHWTRWLVPGRHCVVPFSFSEFNRAEGGDIWFAPDENRPRMLRRHLNHLDIGAEVKEGETTNDIYALLTTEPNSEVGTIHPKAMPVILATPDEVETWMTAPPDEALKPHSSRFRMGHCGS